MRRDGREYPHIEIGLDDGTAAGERVGGRAGRGGDDDAVAAVGVDEAPVDRGLEVEGAAGVHFGEHDVVQGERAHGSGAALLEPGREERAPVLGDSVPASTDSTSSSIEAGLTSVRNPRRPRLMPSRGTGRPATRRAAYRSVPSPPMATMRSARAANALSGQDTTRVARECEAEARIDERALAARLEMADQAEHALGDAQILGIADEGDRLEGGHGGSL